MAPITASVASVVFNVAGVTKSSQWPGSGGAPTCGRCYEIVTVAGVGGAHQNVGGGRSEKLVEGHQYLALLVPNFDHSAETPPALPPPTQSVSQSVSQSVRAFYG
eukprot:6254736-Pyramimonas_sp.AAC.1